MVKDCWWFTRVKRKWKILCILECETTITGLDIEGKMIKKQRKEKIVEEKVGEKTKEVKYHKLQGS